MTRVRILSWSRGVGGDTSLRAIRGPPGLPDTARPEGPRAAATAATVPRCRSAWSRRPGHGRRRCGSASPRRDSGSVLRPLLRPNASRRFPMRLPRIARIAPQRVFSVLRPDASSPYCAPMRLVGALVRLRPRPRRAPAAAVAAALLQRLCVIAPICVVSAVGGRRPATERRPNQRTARAPALPTHPPAPAASAENGCIFGGDGSGRPQEESATDAG